MSDLPPTTATPAKKKKRVATVPSSSSATSEPEQSQVPQQQQPLPEKKARVVATPPPPHNNESKRERVNDDHHHPSDEIKVNDNLYDGDIITDGVLAATTSSGTVHMPVTRFPHLPYMQMPSADAPLEVRAVASMANYFKNYDPSKFTVTSKTWERVKDKVKIDPKVIPPYNEPKEDEKVGRTNKLGEPTTTLVYDGKIEFKFGATIEFPILINVFQNKSMAYGNWTHFETTVLGKPFPQFPKTADQATVELNGSTSPELYHGIAGGEHYAKEAADLGQWLAVYNTTTTTEIVKKGMWKPINEAKSACKLFHIDKDEARQAEIDALSAQDPEGKAPKIQSRIKEITAHMKRDKLQRERDPMGTLVDFMVNHYRKPSDAKQSVVVSYGTKKGKNSPNECHVKFTHHAFRDMTDSERDAQRRTYGGKVGYAPFPECVGDREIERFALINGTQEPMKLVPLKIWTFDPNINGKINIFKLSMPRGALIQVAVKPTVKPAPNVMQLTTRFEFSKVGIAGFHELRAPDVAVEYELNPDDRPREFRGLQFKPLGLAISRLWNDTAPRIEMSEDSSSSSSSSSSSTHAIEYTSTVPDNNNGSLVDDLQSNASDSSLPDI